MEAPIDVMPSVEAPAVRHDTSTPKAALTPPTSEDNDKRFERMSSELSELDSDDGEDIEPDHYFEGGKIPVFKPVCRQLRLRLVKLTNLREPAVMTVTIVRLVKVILTVIRIDHGTVPQLQALHRQDRQVRHEVWYCQGYSAD